MATQQPIQEMALVPKDEVKTDVVSQIVAMAADSGMDVAKLEKLIDMQERVMKVQAESAFNQAFSVMQGEIPTVIEKGKTNMGAYATLEDIVEAIRPVLTKHGFSLSHRTEWPDKGVVKIVGILAHKLGHARTSEFITGADTSGSKNAVQALGSAISYGRRYTTNDLLGVVTRKQDDDATKAAHASVVDPEGYEEWRMNLEVVAREKGLAALTEAWKASKQVYRDHTFKHYRVAWDATKKDAAEVTQALAVKK